MGAQNEWWGHTVRQVAAEDFLSGRGIEIGPGANPQRLPPGVQAVYFDKRNQHELEQLFNGPIGYEVHMPDRMDVLFPSGADFFIAHQVLEHIHAHVPALIDWHSRLRDGGTMVLSVPDKRHLVFDAERPSTPFEHIVLDYALDRTETSYEAREHVASFGLGWAPSWKDHDREGFARQILRHANADENDLHWHALERPVWDRVIALALRLGGVGATVRRIVDADAPAPYTTQGEIIYIYQISRKNPAVLGFPDIGDELDRVLEKLALARRRLLPTASGLRSLFRGVKNRIADREKAAV